MHKPDQSEELQGAAREGGQTEEQKYYTPHKSLARKLPTFFSKTFLYKLSRRMRPTLISTFPLQWEAKRKKSLGQAILTHTSRQSWPGESAA